MHLDCGNIGFSYPHMRKFFVLLLFFILTPSMLVGSLVMISRSVYKTSVLGAATRQEPIAYASLPTMDTVFEGSATFNDKRVTNLTDYFKFHKSPLKPFAGDIVNNADQYHIDYLVLPAIAIQEPGLCTTVLLQAHYNCWGYGIW